jgi:4'-phosphopantetheinyl transferase
VQRVAAQTGRYSKRQWTNCSRHANRVLFVFYRFPMTDSAIHIYLGLLEDVDTSHVRSVCMAMLCPAEREQAERFAFNRHRQQYVLAHGLVRAALSRSAPEVDPTAWRFDRGRYGRPVIAHPQSTEPLCFSLSHTDGLVACVVSPCKSVGIDVEATDRPTTPLEIAETFFSPEELADLLALPLPQRKERFFDYWTLKEAYTKARGMGFHLPLNKFSMLIGPERKLGITFASDFDDDADRWCFLQLSPSRRHRLAVADGSGGGGLPIISQPWPLI